MNGLHSAQGAYDSQIPADDRTDAEIVADADERARERRQAAESAALHARVAARLAITMMEKAA